MATLTASKVAPLQDGVLIRPKAHEAKTSGGIFLPDTAKEKPQEGVVVAVGPGRYNRDGKRVPMQVQVEQVVLYAKYAGTEVTMDEVEHVLLREPEILAVIG